MGFSANHIDPIRRDVGREVPPFEVFDIETNNWKELVLLAHYDGKTYTEYENIEDFLFGLTNLNADGSQPDDRTIFAHNGGAFDFNFVLQYVIKGGQKHFKLETVLPRGSSFLSIEVRRYYRTAAGIEEGPLLIFRDSLALLPFSLASLTDSFHTDCAKGSWDHTYDWKYRWDPVMRQYLRDDNVGLYQVLEKYFSWPLIRESGVSYTVASQALKIFRTTLKGRLVGCPDYVDKFVRKAYFGGRTEIFRPYYVSGEKLYHKMLEKGKSWDKSKWKIYDRLVEKSSNKVDCWDINSLYPSVMRENEFPGKFKKWTHKYDPKSLGFWECVVDVPKGMYVPPVGTLININKDTKKVTRVYDSSQGKYIFPTGRFDANMTTAEIEYARSVGVKVTTGKGAIFESAGFLFKDFIEELYNMRKKAAKDSVDSFICKLIMNSSYGRFGLNLMRDQLVIDDGQECSDSAYEFETGETFNGKPVVMRFIREKKLIQSFTNVAIAAYVTAYARIKMHKHYLAHQDFLYYTDTDSAYIRHNPAMKSSKELGDFKYEYSCFEMCSILPKTYALAGITGLEDKKGALIRAKAVIKGINKEAIKMRKVEVKDLYTLLEGDFRRASIGPIDPLEFYVKEKFAKVRTAMRKGTFLLIQPGQKRTIQSRYDKRVIVKDKDGNYDTVPIHIEDGLALNYSGGKLNIKLSNDGSKKVELVGEAVQTNSDGNSRKNKRVKSRG